MRFRNTISIFCLSVVALVWTLVPTDRLVAQDVEAAAPRVVEARDAFHASLIEKAVELQRAGKLSRRDLLKLRVAMLAPGFRQKAEDLAVIQMSTSGSDDIPLTPEGAIDRASIDWAGLAAFLEKLIPLILQLIDAFSQTHGPPSTMAA